jgi:hypothetical protein
MGSFGAPELKQGPGLTGLRVGEVVEVRSPHEILSTLDAGGKLDALPFMPEMLRFCGQRFRVDKRAIKLCDTINSTGMKRMHNAVHLDGLRCDGSAHGGCQAGCLLYWKESWLKRVPSESAEATIGRADSDADRAPAPASGQEPACTMELLVAATRRDAGADPRAGEVFSCQATELAEAAPEHINWWDLRQYARDVAAGNATPLRMLRSVMIMLFNKFQAANRKFFPRVLFIRNGRNFPFVDGKLTKTPREVLDLRPGDLVQIKPKSEIVRTLDRNNTNRGLSFDTEMLKYCGRQARVLRRVERIIDEKTGRMLRFGGDCIILDGVICTADYNQYCPRGIYPYWREIWLRRVECLERDR